MLAEKNLGGQIQNSHKVGDNGIGEKLDSFWPFLRVLEARKAFSDKISEKAVYVYKI